MGDRKYYFIKNNQVQGPLDYHSILNKIESKELSWLDQACTSDWVDQSASQLKNCKPLLCYPEISKVLTAQLKVSYNQSISVAQSMGQFMDREWYIFRSQLPIGPFTKLEMIQMLQEKALEPENYIWAVGSEEWKKVYEWTEFSKDEVKSLSESSQLEIHQVFYKRKYQRAHFESSLIVNDEKRMFHGNSLEISEGGVGIKLKNSDLSIGHRIFLHFKSGEGVPAFNAVGEIVSRRFPCENGECEVHYGVKFLNVSNHVKDSIRTYTSVQQATS